MAPKKKQQKMALSDFFAEGPAISSWADDDDLALPSAPAPKDPSAPKRGDPNYLASMPDRGARSFGGAPTQREDLPLPTSPPYTCFVGGLAFESTDSDLSDFFSDLNPSSVRLVKDVQGKAKGFGYVEFGNVENLKSALERSGASLGGRTLRISVAEAPSNRKEFAPSAAEESNQWRRAGPVPTRDVQPAPGMGARRTTGPGGVGAAGGPGQFSSAPEAERDWGSARGAKFVPSPAGSGAGAAGGMRREGSGGGFRREEAPHAHARGDVVGPSQADDASAWRSSKPLVQPTMAQQAPAQVSTPGLADTETTWSRGTKLRTPVDSPAVTAPASPAVPSAAEGEKDWRRPVAASRNGSQEGEVRPAPPTERKKLNLAARSSPAAGATPSGSADSTAAPSPRASIFGGAKPIDSAAKEAAAAEKLAQQDKDRRAAAAKAKQEEEGKANSLAAEREKSIKEAQEKALREAGLPVPAAQQDKQERGQGQGQGRPGANRQNSGAQNGQQQQQQNRAKIGPAPANAWGRATGNNVTKPALAKPVAGSGSGSGSSAPAQAQQPREPRKKEEKQYDEDGFEVTASRTRKPAQQQQQQQAAAAVQQQQQQKKSFSWGNVAKTLGNGEDKEKVNGEEDKEVKEVTEGVAEAKI